MHEGRGGHHQPELLILELLDEHDQLVQTGQPGEVTITTLGVEGMPLLRYKTGDICIAHEEPADVAEYIETFAVNWPKKANDQI